MGKKKSLVMPFHKCDLCDFVSKNLYIFKRHRVRCKRDRLGIGGGGIPKVKQQPSGATLFASASTASKIKICRISQDDLTKKPAPPPGYLPGKAIISPKPPVKMKNWNYKCTECEFSTTKSKFFLRHQIFQHGHNFSIFACGRCDYCSKYKHKVQQHLKLVHKLKVEFKDVIVDYEAKPESDAVPKFENKKEERPKSLEDTESENSFSTANTRRESAIGFSTPEKNSAIEDHDSYIEEIVCSGQIKFKCKYCVYSNLDRQRVMKHVQATHINVKQFKCSMCDYTTTKKIEFFAHKAEHGNSLTAHKCPDCDYTTDFKPNFERHRNNHLNKYDYSCDFCTFSCDSEAAVMRHMSSSHSEIHENFTVVFPKAPEDEDEVYEDNDDEEDMESFEDSNMMSGMDISAESSINEMSVCNRSIDSDAGKSTITKDHTISRYGYKLQTPDGIFFCPLCGLKYKRSSDLNRHMKLKHSIKMKEYLNRVRNEENLEAADSSLPDGDDFPEDAPLDLSSPDGMGAPGPGSFNFSEEDLKCKYCQYQAKWPSDLRRHLSVHTVEKRYKCPECCKQYKYVGDLNVHLRRDHKKEPNSVKIVRVPIIPNRKSSPVMFKCPSCSYVSPWKSEVDRHSKLHKGSKPFRCNYCKYETHWKGDIRRHMFKHHPKVMKDGVPLESVITILEDRLRGHRNIVKRPVITIVQDKVQGGLSNVLNNPEEIPGETEIGLDNSYVTDDSVAMETTEDMYGHLDNDNEDEDSMDAAVSDSSEEEDPMESGPSSLDHTDALDNLVKDSPTGLFHCKYCGFATNAPSKLNAHVSTHVNLKQYMCPVCGRRANWKWDIRKHIRKDHPESKLDVVKLSRQEAEATIKTYLDTMPVVRREHHLNCETTQKIAKQPSEQENQDTDSGWKSYKCAMCGFRSSQRWTVSRHIRTMHSGQAIDIIYIPDDKYEVDTLETAPLNVPTNTSTPTQVPKKGTLPSFLPSSTEKIEKPYMCAECGKRCSIKADVRKHYHYIHPNMYVRIMYLDENGATMLPVEQMKSRTPQGNKTSNPTQEDTNKPFKCGEPNCSKRANSRGDIKRHYSFMHPNMEIKILYDGEPSPKVGPVKSPKKNIGRSPTTPNLLSSANPKVFGYIKPFKCSECGHRSNWKWDLNKHMRQKHPHSSCYIIIMGEDEARSTYSEYMKTCTVGPQSVVKKITTPVKKDKMVMNRGVFRQFKCSACPYRSNWRSDLLRHIKRKHGLVRAKIVLLDVDEAKESLNLYQYSPRRGRATGALTKRRLSHDQLTTEEAESEEKVWQCGRCNYSQKDRIAVVNHLSTHGVKAYKCSVCGYATNYRSSAYRHIKAKHNTDNISICRASIKLVRVKSKSRIKARRGSAVGDSDIEEMDEKYEEEDDKDIDFDGTEAEPNSYLDSYRCKKCNFQANWKSSVCRHIRKAHNTSDYNDLVEGFRKYFNSGEKKPIAEVQEKPTPVVHTKTPDQPDKKHACTVCPYRTSKLNMLQFHMSCHKKQPGVHQEKCKYCPYYVVAKRLLHQHMRLHTGTQEVHTKKREPPKPQQVTPVKKPPMFSPPSSAGTPKRHRCNVCPYATNSKNDFLYHKQFHRQKPTSEFKCEYCDYWVTHKRLLKQHLKVHQAAASPLISGSISSSPTKSEVSDSSAIYDTVQLAMYKQRLISAKITSSISQKPIVSPMKLACSVGNRPGFAMKNGVYRKMHKCKKCPYMNVRLRNLRLHELMHGNRKSKNPLLKCPHCDYCVGSKGLLSHHLKVHQPGYMAAMAERASTDQESIDGVKIGDDIDDRCSDTSEVTHESKVDTLFEIARFKKYSCEKCPYASAKRSHYERHVALHGSRQRCQCMYCDYSVPSNNLLHQHQKLHLSPNQNLLAVQSLSNLQLLSEVPADVALASALPPLESKGSFAISVTHDHMDMYENSPELDMEPKKLYRCDRCPYANVRRDHLLAHLKFHMISSELACPYCDYSVAKQHLLTQHIRVHFCPLPELSNWLAQNGEMDRVKQAKEADISEALYIAELYHSDGFGRSGNEKESENIVNGLESGEQKEDKCKTEDLSNVVVKEEQKENDQVPACPSISVEEVPSTSEDTVGGYKEPQEVTEGSRTESEMEITTKVENGDCEKEAKAEGKEVTVEGNTDVEVKSDEYICQYCDRAFPASDVLLAHEMQHLIGNNFEEYMGQIEQISEGADEDELMDAEEPVGMATENGADEKEENVEMKEIDVEVKENVAVTQENDAEIKVNDGMGKECDDSLKENDEMLKENGDFEKTDDTLIDGSEECKEELVMDKACNQESTKDEDEGEKVNGNLPDVEPISEDDDEDDEISFKKDETGEENDEDNHSTDVELKDDEKENIEKDGFGTEEKEVIEEEEMDVDQGPC